MLSNSADGARREESRRYGFPDLVDVLLYSHEIGIAKPDPRAYQLTCERLAVEPTGAVFVDDVPANVEAARQIGMHAVLHTDARQTIMAVEALLRS
ncbi:HAD-IA family hydrolase [Pseudonocardia sp. GCM10023141]|uniref:HAD-IA family hydrolase n=1 Tax=Pseudonocardia sp. GCM10023141 TaxID=3252653 RepID=UPI0036068280